MTSQERFEIVYADVTGEPVESLPQFRCKAIDSYLDPKMSRAYLFHKSTLAHAVVELPASGCFAGYDNPSMMEAELVREALSDAGVPFK